MKASDYSCAICGVRATDSHHRLPRSRGGDNSALNLVALCHADHMRVHANPSWAVGHGWTVPGFLLKGTYRGPDEAYRRFYGGVAA